MILRQFNLCFCLGCFGTTGKNIEDKIGTMLPCNVVVQQTGDGVEVAAIDPVASMQAIPNPGLKDKAGQVADKLRRAIEGLER